ncbi:hypothetical protein NLU13_0341 [Sarocladium strictum]|uniref:Uncharacterized protein n=1 Tax=Sarocladium strictum TaxID=5046 RepID=A0AA39GQC5_SARSR|nr:hypothetical protein NLU13_0341 [Sarocladium strictum]
MSGLTITPQSLTTTPTQLNITFSVDNPPSAQAAVAAGNPIAPATYLQLSFDFGHECLVFPEEGMFTPRDIVPAPRGQDAGGEEAFMVRMNRTGVPKSGDANPEVKMYAWKGEKMLGSWVVGRLGVVVR